MFARLDSHTLTSKVPLKIAIKYSSVKCKLTGVIGTNHKYDNKIM